MTRIRVHFRQVSTELMKVDCPLRLPFAGYWAENSRAQAALVKRPDKAAGDDRRKIHRKICTTVGQKKEQQGRQG